MDNRSDDIGELALALAKAQGMFTNASKDKVNPHFKSKYADMAAVMEACRGQLSANDIAVIQQPVKAAPGWIAINTLLIHKSGQWISGVIELPAGNTTQQYGSAFTYARRYGLSAMVGIVPDDDDDGNAASAKPYVQTPQDRYPAEEFKRQSDKLLEQIKAKHKEEPLGRVDNVPAAKDAKKATVSPENLQLQIDAAQQRLQGMPAGSKTHQGLMDHLHKLEDQLDEMLAKEPS